jgi:oxygen-dependent protoporphyrinogen oxidase
VRIAVIGAGIAGLGAASYLAKKGHRVEILEAGNRPGGRALTLERKRTGDRCDVGTQYYHSSYRQALALMRQVGIDRTLARIEGNTRFFDDRVPSGSFLVHHRLPWMKAAGVAGNARVAWFLIHRILRHRMDAFVLEDRPRLDRARAFDVITDPTVREFLVRVLHVVGGLAEPETTDVSLLHVLRLVRIILLTDYLSLSGGVASLHEALAQQLEVRFETPVERLVTEGERVIGVYLASGPVVRADHVVVAAPAPEAARLLPDTWAPEREFLASVRMPPALIVSFFLDRPLERNVWSYFFQAGKEGAISFCTDPSQKNPAMAPSGKAILQAWVVYPNSEKLVGLNDDELIAACRRELETRFSGFSSWVEEAVVTRHSVGVPWHPAGHNSRALRFLEDVERRTGASFCGDYFSGGYLEPALWSAERVAARLFEP